ncbi:MAG: hypothetical protein RL007_304 [Bacteroidota bacterium]|jgi:hypothetical protein
MNLKSNRTNSDKSAVFQLINSMTQSEKRFFTLYAAMHRDENSRYAELFEFIAGRRKPDSVKLAAQFGERHLEQLKQQLYKKILESLSLQYSKENDQVQVQNFVQRACFLTDRVHSRFSVRELNKAAETAQHLHSGIAALNALHESVRTQLHSGTALLNYLNEKMLKNGSLALQQSIEEHTFTELLLETEMLNRRAESSRSQHEYESILVVLKKLNDNRPKKFISVRSELYFFFASGLLHYLLCRFDQCYTLMNAAHETVERHPELKSSDSILYLRILANRSLSAFHAGKQTVFTKCLQQLRGVQNVPSQIQHYKNGITAVLELMEYNSQGRFREAISKIRLQEKIGFANGNDNEVSQIEIYFTFQSAAALRGAGEIRKASRLIADFINRGGKKLKRDAYLMARILFMLLRVEMGDESLTRSELQSVSALLKKEKVLYAFERVILKYVTRMLVANTKSGISSCARQLLKDLDALRKSRFETGPMMYFDFRKWAVEMVSARV